MRHILVAAAVWLASCSSVPSAAPIAPAPAPLSSLQSTPTGSGGYGPVAGESEFTFAASLASTNTELDIPGQGSNTDNSFNGQVGYGRYLTDEHEVGGQFLFNLFMPDQGDDQTQLGVLPYYRYNFRQSDRTWFYAGVQAGLQQFEQGGESDTAFSYGIHGGMKSWLTPQVSVFVEPRLTFSEFEFGPISLDSRDFRILLGLSYTF